MSTGGTVCMAASEGQGHLGTYELTTSMPSWLNLNGQPWEAGSTSE